MPLTATDITDSFPELARAGNTLIASKLADAQRMTAADLGGDPALRDQVVRWYTAHLIATSPGGEFARLDPNKEPDGARSIYERELNSLTRSLSSPIAL